MELRLFAPQLSLRGSGPFLNFSTILAHCRLISGWYLGWGAAGTEN